MKNNKFLKIIGFVLAFILIVLALKQVKNEYSYKMNGETIISIKHNGYYKTSIRYDQSVYPNGKRDTIQTRKVCSLRTFAKSLFDCQYNQVLTISVFTPDDPYYSSGPEGFNAKEPNETLIKTKIGNYDGYYYDEIGSGRVGLIFLLDKMIEINWLNPVYSWNGVNQKDIDKILESMVIRQ